MSLIVAATAFQPGAIGLHLAERFVPVASAASTATPLSSPPCGISTRMLQESISANVRVWLIDRGNLFICIPLRGAGLVYFRKRNLCKAGTLGPSRLIEDREREREERLWIGWRRRNRLQWRRSRRWNRVSCYRCCPSSSSFCSPSLPLPLLAPAAAAPAMLCCGSSSGGIGAPAYIPCASSLIFSPLLLRSC